MYRYAQYNIFPSRFKPLNEQQISAELPAEHALAVLRRPDAAVPANADDAAAKRHVSAAVHVPADAAEPPELPVGFPAGLQPDAAVRPDAERAVWPTDATGPAADAGPATGPDPISAVLGSDAADPFAGSAATTGLGPGSFPSGTEPDADRPVG